MRSVIFEEHQDLYHYAVGAGLQNLKLIHFDLHCDMRGGTYRQADQKLYLKPNFQQRPIDSGNFMCHLIRHGIVKESKWVYPPEGGPENDLGTVQFGDDVPEGLTGHDLLFSSLAPGNPIKADGFYLDIDWDYFHGFNVKRSRSKELMEALFEDVTGRPEGIFLTYSSGFVRNSIGEFNRFIEGLKTRFPGLEVEYYRQPREPLCNSFYYLRHVIKGIVIKILK